MYTISYPHARHCVDIVGWMTGCPVWKILATTSL